MVKFKVVIADPKQGKALQKEVDSTEVTAFKRKRIGDKVDGKSLGYEGYEFEITGGSDSTGFPMRRDVDGIARKRILIVSGVGLRKRLKKGTRKRKMVAGNTISLKTAQINLKVVKYGKGKLDFPKKEGEAKAEEAPKKEAKPEVKKEEVKQEKEAKAEEAPKKEAKPEVKKEEVKQEKEAKAGKKEDEKPKEKEEKPAKKTEKPKAEEKPTEEKKEAKPDEKK